MSAENRVYNYKRKHGFKILAIEVHSCGQAYNNNPLSEKTRSSIQVMAN